MLRPFEKSLERRYDRPCPALEASLQAQFIIWYLAVPFSCPFSCACADHIYTPVGGKVPSLPLCAYRYTYGNGRADTHAKHQSTSQTPGLEHLRLDTPHHSHLQHLPLIPSATQPPQPMPEDAPYTDRDKQYPYPTPIQQLATTLGHLANTELLRRLQDSVHTPLYYSALRPDSLRAHLQKTRLQLAREQLPLLT